MKYVLSLLLALVALSVHAQRPDVVQDISFKANGLETTAIKSISCTGFWRQPSFNCKPITIPAYFAKANTGNNNALVIISPGSQGLDKRHSDYAHHLAANGMNALVLDHWTARGVKNSHFNYLEASAKGANAWNMAIDVLAVSSEFKSRDMWKDAKIGYIGESVGGSAAINVTRPYISEIVAEQMGLRVQGPDAIVALYPGCIDRDSEERFKPTKLLILAGEKDNITPAASCKQWTSWINQRGGSAEFISLPGQPHDFDAPYAYHSIGVAQNVGDCNNARVGNKFVMDSTGKEYPGTPEGFKTMRMDCTKQGGDAGHQGNTKTGYDIWTTYFSKQLME
jgi:dienelactone hydrolase